MQITYMPNMVELRDADYLYAKYGKTSEMQITYMPNMVRTQ